MDLGKATIQIPADLMPFGDVERLADAVATALRQGAYGEVLSVAKLRYDPFTPDAVDSGRRWNAITISLDRVMSLGELKELLMSSGTPGSAFLTYTDQMRLCGESLAGPDHSSKPTPPRGSA